MTCNSTTASACRLRGAKRADGASGFVTARRQLPADAPPDFGHSGLLGNAFISILLISFGHWIALYRLHCNDIVTVDVYGNICWKPLFYPQPPLLGARLCRGTVQARDRHPQHQKPGTNWQRLILKKIDGKAKSYHSVAYMNQFFISIPVMDGLMFYASILGKL